MAEFNEAQAGFTKETIENSNLKPSSLPTPNSFDSDDLLDNFTPVPYMFLLKDAYGDAILLPPHQLNNARVECPRFHVLIDHLVAVLWIYYSKKELELLESNQIHWALKILEGTRNRYGQHTEDIEMAINHLTHAYIDVCSRVDLEKIESREYTSKTDTRSSHQDTKFPMTNEFGEFGTSNITRSAEENSNAAQRNTLKNASLHLADMVLDADPAILKELISQPESTAPKIEENVICLNPYAEDLPPSNEPDEVGQERQKLVDLRNSKFQTFAKLFEEIRLLDETLQDMPSNRTGALKNMIEPIPQDPDNKSNQEREKVSDETPDLE